MTALDPRFICTSDLQELLRDKASGLPLSGGIITFYSDINRSLLKPVYQISSTGGATYAYNPLPNPCVLSMAGTFQDALGNDIVPYYYPFTGTPAQNTGVQELYYITVENSGFTPQFTREGWPQAASGSGGGGGGGAGVNVYNFVRNPQFYAWTYLPNSATGYGNVAAGVSGDTTYDTANDWQYYINDPTQTVNINRGMFTPGQIGIPPGDAPYYFQYVNTNVGSSAATSNYLIQTYNSVQTLSGQTVTISFWMQSSLTNFSGQNFTLQLIQNFGTGGSSPVYIPVINLTSVTSTGWTQYTATIPIPALTSMQTIGITGSDSLQLQFLLPLNIAMTINIANVLMQVGTVTNPVFPLISNDDQYNATDTISQYSIFRTGDVKMTLRNTNDPGWLLMDDTTIGAPGSNANHYGWSLYNLYSMIWNNVNSTAWAPLYNSSGVPQSAYGVSAQADWTAGNQLSLTKALGRVLAGAGTSSISYIVTATNSSGLLIHLPTGVNNILLTGDPVTFYTGSGGVLPTGLSAATTYYVIQISGNTYNVATSVANAVAGTAISYSDSGTNPFYIMLNASTWALGQIFGEQTHSILGSQLPITQLGIFTNSSSGSGVAGAGLISGSTLNTVAISPFGGSVPMNVMQPATFLNVMIKL